MSLFYSGLYLSTKYFSFYFSVIVPIGSMIFYQLKSMASTLQPKIGQSQIFAIKSSLATENSGSSPKNILLSNENSNYRCNYGKWTIFILSMLFFSILNSLFPKSFIIILLGFILKMAIIYTPNPVAQSIEVIIQKLHLQVHLETLNFKAIEAYLDLSEKVNFFIIFYSNKERQQQLNVLNRMKDSVSRIELELEQNSEIKNRSFIVAVKKMQSMPKKIKSFQNIGVNCELIKPSSDVGKELLQILSSKTFAKDPQNNTQKMEQPTKDHFDYDTKGQRSSINPGRSESLQEKVERMKGSQNIPTSEKKRVNQVKVKDTPFMIKRSQTDIFEQNESEQESPKRTRQNRLITWSNTRTQKLQTRPEQNLSRFSPSYSHSVIHEENSSSGVTNQNTGILDRAIKENQSLDKIPENDEGMREDQIYVNSIMITEEPTSPKVIPAGINISSIGQPNIHPFKINLSSLSNPLILSNTISNTKILPNSVVTSNEYQIISDIQQSTESKILQNPLLKNQFSSVSNTNTINAGEHFSEESSIPNKHEVSISESDYSDMFESDQEEEAKLEIKVEVIIENARDNGLKPRMEICYIELYSNNELRFMSMHDKLLSTGKLLKIIKKPQNYYELIILEQNEKGKAESKQQEEKNARQVTKRIKFRGQARPFMKYLEKP